MVRLILLLLGHDFTRRRWLMLALVGLIWTVLGAAIFVDALDGVAYFPIHVFGYLLLIEAVVTLVVSPPGADTRVVLRKARGVVFLLFGLLVVDEHHAANVILAMLFGIAFLADGIFRMAAAVVVRFPGWRLSFLTGLFEVGFAIFMFEPYPTFYAGTLPYCIGMGIFLSGCGLVRQAIRLKRLPRQATAARWRSRDLAIHGALLTDVEEGVSEQEGELIVHVWTPAGSVDEPVPQPVIDRYIAAVDSKGVISTGHAALEAAPDIYISHYPKVEIDRSQTDFSHALRATADNDVPGRFQPSYLVEATGWCNATAEVRFGRYNRARLVAFWEHYRSNDTYNLTNRNCSSTVAHALEAALEGSLAQSGSGLNVFLRAVFNPELWVAAQLERRARAMAWTPGLVLDYARTLRAAIQPTPLGWSTLVSQSARFWRIVRRHEPVRDVEAIRHEVKRPH
ncbi:HdeD family acid-resistance protein [Dyella nitratireducens]|uniref:DUF308 domain-containing protein n=1 Tax=Dyella nitratireducens TaxID=1849580 RepID=A0ABQ1FLY1_9GAMM|nr:DUF308 domain-containing protein [Dyella nitratireducens]GGA21978.1 hypothetical protein GCM10010981_07660 [Dyella nitratireducens]GLQ44174.1 hypothetical protein GCM10007902_40240 [Dyella nitratireducens]